jgi:hypothetical protein
MEEGWILGVTPSPISGLDTVARGRPVQSGARRDGIAGIPGNPGIVESVTYRF